MNDKNGGIISSWLNTAKAVRIRKGTIKKPYLPNGMSKLSSQDEGILIAIFVMY